MRKELKIVAVVLAAILLFLVGFGLGTTKGITFEISVSGTGTGSSSGAVQTGGSSTAQPSTTQQQPVAEQTTAAPTPDASAPAGDSSASNSGAAETTAAPSGDASASTGSSVPSTPAEVVKAYNDAINAVKNCSNVTVHHVSTINLECTDCSLSIAKPVINTALPVLAKGSDWTRTYVDGKQTDGDQWINDMLPPGSKECALTEADVASATAAADGDGYKITLKIKSEVSTFDGTNTVNPTSHEKAMTPLNLASIEIPIDGASITQADMNYPGATCEATIDGSGRMTYLHIYLPMDGSGTGGYKGMNISVGIAGDLDDTFELSY